MSKKKTQSTKPKQIKLTPEEIAVLLAQLEGSNLGNDAKSIFKGLVDLNGWLIQQLEEGNLTIAKLRRLFACISEPNKKKERKGKANKSSNGEKKGHGRNHSDEYTGATTEEVKHNDLKAGDDCPLDGCTGKLYQVEPGVVINIEGTPIASAKKYLIEKLRCALCGELFVAPTPDDVNPEKKYSESFAAMLMINKYFMAAPLYRQETLQNMLGIPLPTSTQWDIIASYEPLLKIIYQQLMQDAANGKGFHLDDTSAKILEVIKEREKEGKKAGKCFTTGMISVHNDHRVALFVTDENIAGKTFAPVFALRYKALPEPYIMMDALTANIPEEIEKGLYTLCYCIVHARRNFYDLGDGYDDLVDFVIDSVSTLYDNDKKTKSMNEVERLAYHQKHSQQIMDDLKAHLELYKKDFEPNSSAGKAIDYILKRWTEMTQFLRYGDTPLDNNEVERALKIPIRNRKNSMFYKTRRGAAIAGYIQSMIYSAAQNAINPYHYLKSVLTHKDQAMKNPKQWLPWNYESTLAGLEPSSGCHDGSSRVA